MTIIRWWRSWPKYPGVPTARNRAHIVDHLPRIEIDRYDYASATDGLPTDAPGFCLLEWDVALSKGERRGFAEVAAASPNSILVAPYSIYDLEGNPSCVHRFIGGDPIPDGYPACETFGMGCIYLPLSIVEDFMTRGVTAIGMTDASFSRWVHDNYGNTAVDWRFHPQHLSGD